MSQTQLFHSAICAFINLASLSSVVSICLLNLPHSLLFLSLSSLVAMLHHVFWLSVFTVYSLLHVTLIYPGVGFPCLHRGFSCMRRSYDSCMITTQCGAFRIRNVNFVHATLLQHSHRLLTSVGLAQARPNHASITAIQHTLFL